MLDKETIKRLCSCIPEPKDERDIPLAKVIQLPPSVDHTAGMTAVKNQGNLGSCVAFATAAVIEFFAQKEQDEEVSQGKEYHRKLPYDLSEQWIYRNCKKIDGYPNDEGTYIRAAMKVLNSIGVPEEKGWPYSDIQVGRPESWTHLVARWNRIGEYQHITNLNELKSALVKAPVAIAVHVFDEWFQRHDVIPAPRYINKSHGLHAICVIGYDDSTETIEFKNSWGIFWGNEGYGRLSYRYIDLFMNTGWACQDIQVVRGDLKGSVSLK